MLGTRRRFPLISATVTGLLGLLAGTVIGLGVSGLRATPARTGTAAAGPIAGFRKVVYLSHLNDPHRTPGFPGDPRFFTTTAFTVAKDGYYLQYVREGEHTGTHWGAPCHFHALAAKIWRVKVMYAKPASTGKTTAINPFSKSPSPKQIPNWAI